MYKSDLPVFIAKSLVVPLATCLFKFIALVETAIPVTASGEL